jgi:hypothetical protein
MKRGDILFYLLAVVIIGNLGILLYREKDSSQNFKTQTQVLIDSVGKAAMENAYSRSVIDVAMNNNAYVVSSNPLVLDVEDVDAKNPKPLHSLLKTGKKKLVVRYTEIGCSCADSVFSFINKKKNYLAGKYDIFVLIDFSNPEYYIKWKKILDVQDRIYLLEKGSLPFNIEQERTSYVFVVNPDNLVASSFFIPDSKHLDYLENYFNHL